MPPEFDPGIIANNLIRDESGIWIAPCHGEISYPPEGNATCYQVEDSSYWFRHRNQVIRHLVLTHSPRDVLFDIGGGNGCVAESLQGAGVNVVLLEPGPSGTRNARRRGIQTVIQSRLEDAGFAPDSIPSVGLFDVLEHIPADTAFLRTLHGCLRYSGHMYITVPAYSTLWSVEDDHVGHYRRYTARALSKQLIDAGFTIVYCGYFFSLLVAPIFVLRSIPSWVGLRQRVTAASTRTDHTLRTGMIGRSVEAWLEFELRWIERGWRIPLGSSCIAVARK